MVSFPPTPPARGGRVNREPSLGDFALFDGCCGYLTAPDALAPIGAPKIASAAPKVDVQVVPVPPGGPSVEMIAAILAVLTGEKPKRIEGDG